MRNKNGRPESRHEMKVRRRAEGVVFVAKWFEANPSKMTLALAVVPCMPEISPHMPEDDYYEARRTWNWGARGLLARLEREHGLELYPVTERCLSSDFRDEACGDHEKARMFLPLGRRCRNGSNAPIALRRPMKGDKTYEQSLTQGIRTGGGKLQKSWDRVMEAVRRRVIPIESARRMLTDGYEMSAPQLKRAMNGQLSLPLKPREDVPQLPA